MFAFFVAMVTLVGLLVGSFLNVLILRIPEKKPWVNERSECPNCKHQLAAKDLVPVFSWLFLKGKCRYCQAPISKQYPLVELANAALWLSLSWHFGFNWALPSFLIFVSALLAISVIDLHLYIIPNRIVYPAGYLCLALLTIAAFATHDWHSFKMALAGSVGAWLFLLIIHLISPRGMGFGDVRLAALIGLNLGWLGIAHVFVGIFGGFFIGAIVGIAMMAFKGASRKSALPFGPFLAMGAYVGLFVTYPALETLIK